MQLRYQCNRYEKEIFVLLLKRRKCLFATVSPLVARLKKSVKEREDHVVGPCLRPPLRPAKTGREVPSGLGETKTYSLILCNGSL